MSFLNSNGECIVHHSLLNMKLILHVDCAYLRFFYLWYKYFGLVYFILSDSYLIPGCVSTVGGSG
jgi:hypothetical protein